MPSKSREEDEFILTISDNDDSELSDASNEPAPISNKRKRTDTVSQRNHKRARKVSNNVQSDSEASQEDQQERDETFDSDFEFDAGVANGSASLEDFDGWGPNDAVSKEAKVLKKGVDVDDIIERRAEKRLTKNKAQSEPEEDISSNVEVDEEDAESEEDVEISFDDDNLAEDAFGAGVEDEEEEGNEDSDAGSGSDHDSDSENDSVASPVAHPDDMDSNNGASSDNESQTSHSDVEEAAKRKAFFAVQDDQPATKLSSVDSFQQFSLSRPLLRAVTTLGFTSPTPIQARTIPIALQGIDVVGSAQTGSGKTAAFLLPILERLLYRPRKIPTTRVAILMPTRELAVQCFNVATALSRYTDITFAQVVGGFSLRDQETILKKRPDVVIATPGRFIDHMRNSPSFTVDTLEILVLDEADRMLEQGFTDELDEILRTIPRSRQTMLFSATMTSSVDKLVRLGMNKPVRLSVDTTHSTVSGLTQEFLRLRPGKDTPQYRLATLCTLLTTCPEYTTRTIIFVRQKKEAHRIRIILGLLGFKPAELHGNMTQDQRISAVTSFRDGHKSILLATDVASRGLDIKNVQCVINFDCPSTHEIYLHRVGRTARAGKVGRSCTLASEPDRKLVKAAVKAARSQGAKVSSRVLDATAVSDMHDKLSDMEGEVDEILKEEKAEKDLAQMEAEVTRGQNLVKHREEILARPKRTWFESEREKQAGRDRARVEEVGMSGGMVGKRKSGNANGKLSNKDRKRMELTRERKEGRQWKKGREDGDSAVKMGRSKRGGGKGGRGGAKGGGKKRR